MSRAICVLALALLAPVLLANEAGHPVTLWKVAGSTNSVYLLGSVHLLREEDYPLPTALDAAYRDADVLVMEVDMDDLDPLATQAAFSAYGMTQGETTLRDLMGVDLYEQAQAAADLIDVPLDMLHKTEPWYAAMTVEIMLLNRIGFNPALGVEMHMMARAKSDGKRIDGLETAEEQIRFLDSMSVAAQRDMLLSTLTEGAELSATMDDLIEAWRNGDLAVLESEMLAALDGHEELRKVLVTDRNRRWVAHIEDLLGEAENYLVVVGALHLIGTQGVPAQLQQLGFDVHQLSEPPTVR